MILDNTTGQPAPGGAGRRQTAVLGIGGMGIAILRRIADLHANAPGPLALMAADTDASALEGLPEGVAAKMFGERWTGGNGCGKDLTLGENAAMDARAWFRELVESHGLVLVTAGLGGGAGGGACRVLARIARETRTPVFFVLMLPFSSDGSLAVKAARESLERLRELTSNLIVVPNDYIFCSRPADAPAPLLLQSVRQAVAECLYGMVSARLGGTLLPVDFLALGTLLAEKPVLCGLGVGVGQGERRWKTALDAFLDAPLSGGRISLDRAEGAWITLGGGEDVAIGEIQTGFTELQHLFPESAKIVSGAYVDPRLAGTLRLSGVILYPLDERSSRGNPAAAASPEQTEKKPKRGRVWKSKKKQKSPAGSREDELPLQIHTFGIFAGIQSEEPTVEDGVNLDVPTYQREGIIVDSGK